MNSQVWLNNKELQSAAALHPSVLGCRHQTLYRSYFVADEKGRVFLTVQHLRKVP